MDKINHDMVYLCSENARIKLKTLASTLKMSSQRLKYSFAVLEKGNILYNPYCVFDYSYFGLVLFKVYFKGGYIVENDKQEIIKRLSENPYVVSLYEMSGEFDLAIEIISPNPSRFNKELRKVAGLIPTLNKYKVILNIVSHIYPKSYLSKNIEIISNVPPEIIIGGDREREIFSDNENKVMSLLLANPKLRSSSLAKQSGLNIKTIVTVLKQLQEKKIIRGFKYLINTTKLDISNFRLFLKIHNLSSERESQFLEYMLKIPEIVQLHKTVGDWDMEVDLESLDKATIRKLIMEIREKFKDIIGDFNLIEFYTFYKKSYLPSFLFEEKA